MPCFAKEICPWCSEYPRVERHPLAHGGLVVPRGSRPHGTPKPTRNLARHRMCGSSGRPRQNPRGTEPVVAASRGTSGAFSAQSLPPAHTPPRCAFSAHGSAKPPEATGKTPEHLRSSQSYSSLCRQVVGVPRCNGASWVQIPHPPR